MKVTSHKLRDKRTTPVKDHFGHLADSQGFITEDNDKAIFIELIIDGRSYNISFNYAETAQILSKFNPSEVHNV